MLLSTVFRQHKMQSDNCDYLVTMHLKKRKCTPTRWLLFGTILMVAGCALLITWPWIFDFISKRIKTLTPESFTFSVWRKNPMPLNFDVYVFNWTNPQDIYKPNIKLKFEEVGPFVFWQTKEKVNITWNDNGTITYKHLNFWYFDEGRSVANLSAKVNIPDMLALAASHRVRDWSYVMKKGFEISLRSFAHAVYTHKSIGQLLFEGYDDPLFALAKSLPFTKNMKIPDLDKFGFFYTRNNSADYEGAYNMDIGEKDFGRLRQWKYRNESVAFKDGCNKIDGSAGEFFRSNLQRDHIKLFSPDLCRPITMDYVEDVFVGGIRGYKFVVGESFLDNGTKVSENLCYVSGENIPSGAVNISSCKYGTPGTVTLPHMYRADPFYLEKIEGLHPNKDKHEMFMVLEPITGIPLHVEARLQMNALIQPIKSISLYEDVPKVHIPMIWFEQKAIIPSHLLILLFMFVYFPLIMRLLAFALIVTGMATCVLAVRNLKLGSLFERRKRTKTIIEMNANDAGVKLLKQ